MKLAAFVLKRFEATRHGCAINGFAEYAYRSAVQRLAAHCL